MDFNTNHYILKHLEEELRKCESSEVTPRKINSNTINDHIDQTTHIGKRVIVPKSDQGYLAYTIS